MAGPFRSARAPRAHRRHRVRTAAQCSHEAFLKRIEGKTTGAIRASLGAVSNVADLEALLRFLATYLEGGDHHHRSEGSPRSLSPG